jgi:hypothetical protein
VVVDVTCDHARSAAPCGAYVGNTDNADNIFECAAGGLLSVPATIVSQPGSQSSSAIHAAQRINWRAPTLYGDCAILVVALSYLINNNCDIILMSPRGYNKNGRIACSRYG